MFFHSITAGPQFNTSVNYCLFTVQYSQTDLFAHFSVECNSKLFTKNPPICKFHIRHIKKNCKQNAASEAEIFGCNAT